jgi:ferredoxin-like protein FixX
MAKDKPLSLEKAGVGEVIASEGNWELRHTDREVNERVKHNAVIVHYCPKDPGYNHWGTPGINSDGDRELSCGYCEVVAPTELVNQWFDNTKEENL